MDTDDIATSSVLLLILGYMLFVRKNNKHRKKRRWAVRPINRVRHQHGQYNQLFKQLKSRDHEQFFIYTRMSVPQFDFLLKLVKPSLTKEPCKNPLSPEHRLAMTLQFLSQGSSLQSLAWSFYVGKTTVHCVVLETCRALWTILKPLYLPVPSEEEWNNIARGFLLRCNMPHCMGALDGKHINIQAPKSSGTKFFNYKKDFSIVLMATCDSYYRFTLVDIGAYGSQHDGGIFTESGFGRALESSQLNIPGEAVLPGTDTMMPHYFVADQAFPLKSYIMRPYPGSYLPDHKKIFNYRLSRARRLIENTFGIMVQRWRLLRNAIVADVANVEDIVKAIVVLHNFVQQQESCLSESERRYCPTGYADYLDINGEWQDGLWRQDAVTLRSVTRMGSNNASRSVINLREKLAAFFISPAGFVPWQNSHIKKGVLPSN